MTRVLDISDGFSAVADPTTSGASSAAFLKAYANDAAYEAVYAAVAGSAYYDTTLKVIKMHDGTSWQTNEQELNNATNADPGASNDNTEGYAVLSLWLNTSSGALFRATDVSTGAAVWQEIAADSILDTHISATNAHGTSSAVVGISDAQDLSNKTFTDGVILQEIAEPSSPPSGDQHIYIDSTSKTMKRKDSAGTVFDIGSGGGGLDVFHTQDFEAISAVNASGNNAAFLGGGALDGAFALETTSEMSGAQSGKYTASTTSNNDYIEIETIDLDLKQRDQFIKCRLLADMTGFANDVTFIIYDKTNAAVLTTSTDVLTASEARNFYEFSVFVPSTCAQLSWGFHMNNGATNTESFLFDDAEFSTNPFVYKNLKDISAHGVRQANGYGSTNTHVRKFSTPITGEINDNGAITYTADATNGDSWTVNIDGEYKFTWTDNFNSATIMKLTKNAATLNGDPGTGDDVLASTTTATTNPAEITWSGYASAGDIFRCQVQANTAGGGAGGRAFLSAITESEHVITPAKSIYETYRADTHAGFGSTNTKVPYYTNERENTIDKLGTITNDATSGCVFTASQKCIVTMTYSIGHDGTGVDVAGISKNATLTTSFSSLTGVNALAGSNSSDIASGGAMTCTVTEVLESGDYIVPHTQGGAPADTNFYANIISIQVQKYDATFLAAVPMNYFQEKILTADVTTNTTISDFTINNLVVGKAYEVKWNLRMESNASSFYVDIENGSTVLNAVYNGSSGLEEQTRAGSKDFVADSSTVTFTTVSVGGGDAVRGDGTKRESWVQIKELNYTKITTRFT